MEHQTAVYLLLSECWRGVPWMCLKYFLPPCVHCVRRGESLCIISCFLYCISLINYSTIAQSSLLDAEGGSLVHGPTFSSQVVSRLLFVVFVFVCICVYTSLTSN